MTTPRHVEIAAVHELPRPARTTRPLEDLPAADADDEHPRHAALRSDRLREQRRHIDHARHTEVCHACACHVRARGRRRRAAVEDAEDADDEALLPAAVAAAAVDRRGSPSPMSPRRLGRGCDRPPTGRFGSRKRKAEKAPKRQGGKGRKVVGLKIGASQLAAAVVSETDARPRAARARPPPARRRDRRRRRGA